MANRIEMILSANDQASAVIGGLGRSLTSFATGPIGLVVGAAVGLTTAIFNMARGFAEEIETLDNLSRASGASVQELQILQRVTENQGLAAGSLTSAMRFLNREIAEGNPLLARIGVTSHDAHEALLQLSDAFSRSDDAAAKNKIAMMLLGRGGSDLIAVLDNLRQKSDEVSERFGVSTDAELSAARKLDSEMDKFADRWEGFMNRMKGASASWANAVIDHGKRVKDFYTLKGTLSDIFTRPDPRQFLPAHGEAGGGLPGSDPNLAGALKESTRSLADLASAYDTFVEIRERDGRASLTGKDLFSALLGTGGDAGGGGRTPGFSDFMDTFQRDNEELATVIMGTAAGIESGFVTAFTSIGQHGYNLTTFLTDIFLAMEREIAAAIGRIAAKWATIGIGTTIGGPIGGFIAGLFTGASQPRSEALAADQRTFVIQTFQPKDVAGDLLSPFGSLRRGSDRVFVAGAF